ncbi:helix-turn-helix domain-containing protein [Rhodoblastus sp.]|uniref:helix-turn-helix domain-containing protein n=1 Tax=Rhodoblastus sp. TaxID=1962975 RepID=UPI0035B3AA2D
MTDAPARIQTKAAASMLGISPRSVQCLAAQGLLPGAAKIGKVWTFDRVKLARYIAAQEAETEANGACLRKISTSAARRGGFVPPLGASKSEKAYELAMQKLLGAGGMSNSRRFGGKPPPSSASKSSRGKPPTTKGS